MLRKRARARTRTQNIHTHTLEEVGNPRGVNVGVLLNLFVCACVSAISNVRREGVAHKKWLKCL